MGGGAADSGQQRFAAPPGDGGWRPCAGTLGAGGVVQYTATGAPHLYGGYGAQPAGVHGQSDLPQQGSAELNRGPGDKSAVEIIIDALLRRGILPPPAAAGGDQRRALGSEGLRR